MFDDQSAPVSGLELFPQVFDDGAVFLLRTEEDNLCICADSNGMTGWPIEQVIASHGFLSTVCIGDGDLSLD